MSKDRTSADGTQPDAVDRLAGLNALERFEEVLDPHRYTALPDDWIVGVTDVERSTDAIRHGRYKAVNIAGAAAISALMNALGTPRFPFAFGGDGSSFALPGADAPLARAALAGTQAFVKAELKLSLRAAIVPVHVLRESGVDVRVALYHPGPAVAYAMFDGGGIAFAEKEMKAGRLTLDRPHDGDIRPAPQDAPPGHTSGPNPASAADFSGLSCRWLPLKAQNGAILSLIVRPGTAGDAAFREAVRQVFTVVRRAEHHPVPVAGPAAALLSPGIDLEARLTRVGSRGRSLWRRRAAVALHSLMGWFLFATRLKVGGFDPETYRKVAASNADAAKFGDALMLTADCDAATERALRATLDRAAAEGALRYGLHRQSAALMTCIVPSYVDDGHFHFIDGAGGGYAMAAAGLRETPPPPP